MAVKKKNIQFKVNIPRGLPSEIREEIGARIIEFVQSRTSKGLDKDNKAFPKYDKEYKESQDFKAVGKTSKVNLRLSGDMMDSLDVVNTKDGELTIGYDLGDEVAGRVEGNVIGSYGDKVGHPDKARDFLGIKDSRLELIIEEVLTETAPTNITDDVTESVISSILSRFGENNEDG